MPHICRPVETQSEDTTLLTKYNITKPYLFDPLILYKTRPIYLLIIYTEIAVELITI